MLSHIEEILPPTMHVPVSSEDTLPFYTYLHTHIQMPIDSSATYRYPYTGTYATTFNVPNFYLGHSSWKFHSMIQCQYPISLSHRGQNYGSGNFNTSSAYVKKLMDNFAILIHLFNCLPTLHLALQPYTPRMQPALPLDAHYKSGRLKASAYHCQLLQMYGYWLSTFYSDNWNNPHLPKGNNRVYHSTETHPHLVTTTSLQCYITTLSFTTMIWTSSISS